jgi:hypothetical protein
LTSSRVRAQHSTPGLLDPRRCPRHGRLAEIFTLLKPSLSNFTL